MGALDLNRCAFNRWDQRPGVGARPRATLSETSYVRIAAVPDEESLQFRAPVPSEDQLGTDDGVTRGRLLSGFPGAAEPGRS